MKYNKIILALLLAPLGFIYLNAATLETTRGKLGLLTSNLSSSETELVLKGEIDARDFPALVSLPASIVRLDMSALTVAECDLAVPSAEGKSFYGAGTLPGYVFFQSKLKEVSLPKNLVELPEGAFAASSVTKVTVPSGCTSVGNYAFYSCKELSEVSLPKSIKKIGERAFAQCSSLQNVDLPAGVELAGAEIFFNSGVTGINLNEVSSYSDFSLSGAYKLKEPSLNPDAEYGTGILMNDYSLGHVYGTPEDVPDLFAANTSWLNVNEILDGVSIVGDYAFANTKASNIVLTPGLSYIGKGAFANANNIQAIDANPLGGAIPDVDEDAFKGIDHNQAILYVTPESFDLWKAHPVWGTFKIVAGESKVNSINAANGIKITAANGMVEIFASPMIGSYKIYSTDGMLLTKGNSQETHVDIPHTGWNKQVLIVKVSNPEGENTATILVN